MIDDPKDDPKRSLEDEIRYSVEERVRRNVQRATDRASRRMYRRSGRAPGMFFGLVILALGVIFLLDQQGILPAHIAFRYFWGLVLMAWGVEIVVSSRHSNSWFWGIVIIIFGAGSLVTQLGIFHFWAVSFWPLLLIAIGAVLILQRIGIIPPGGPFYHRNWGGPVGSGITGTPGTPGAPGRPGGIPPWPPAPPPAPNMPGPPNPTAQGFAGGYAASSDADSGFADAAFSQVAVLSGFKRRITSQKFRFANVSAVLGGFEIDLTRADIDGEEAVVQVHCVLGGGEIRIPDSWKVLVETDTIGGGFSDETFFHPGDPAKPPKRLVVRGTLVFGGIVIKN